jgi:hypothetical protein
MPSTTGVCRSLLSLLKHYGWTRYTPIVQVEGGSNFREAANTLKGLAMERGITVNDAV